MDWKKIQRARRRIEEGFYTDSEVLKRIEKGLRRKRFCARVLQVLDEGPNEEEKKTRDIATGVLSNILLDLKKCPEGKGHLYRDIVAEIFASSLVELVDISLMRREFPCKGGRGDFELPLRIENLSDFILWDKWCVKYNIKSIIVEVKNKKSQAMPSDVAQILSYIIISNLGRFGILVSRSGFRESAMKQLQAISSTNQFLVLPFEQRDLEYLATLHNFGQIKCMELFRRKATLLAQSA